MYMQSLSYDSLMLTLAVRSMFHRPIDISLLYLIITLHTYYAIQHSYCDLFMVTLENRARQHKRLSRQVILEFTSSQLSHFVTYYL